MSIRYRLTCFLVLVMLCGFTGNARCQILTITDVQYTAAAGCKKATSKPKGTFSYPGTGKSYRPFVDYGYIDKGVFTPDTNVSAGGKGAPRCSRRWEGRQRQLECE